MDLFKKKHTQPKKSTAQNKKARPKQWTPPFASKRVSMNVIDVANTIQQTPKLIEVPAAYTISAPSEQEKDIFPELPSAPEPVKQETWSKGKRAKQEFLKTFKKLTRGNWRSWDIWTDFVTMAACTISNAVDKSHFDEREELYLSIINKYSKEEQAQFPELFAYMVISLEENPEQDFLGDLYTELDLNSKEHGQIFTPYDVCCLMAEMTIGDLVSQVEEQGVVTIHDGCCGAGATLIAAANVAKEKLEKANLNFQNHILITGQDIDRIATMMCYIQLSLLGVAGYFKVGNTLTEPMTDDDSLENYWFTPMYFFPVWSYRRFWNNLDILMKGDESHGEV